MKFPRNSKKIKYYNFLIIDKNKSTSSESWTLYFLREKRKKSFTIFLILTPTFLDFYFYLKNFLFRDNYHFYNLGFIICFN